MSRSQSVVAPIAAMAVILAAAVSFAGGTDSAAQMYRQYCGACHGLEGKGDGPVSGFLRPRPTDLTQLSKNHNGEFPFADVLRIIDGRATVRSHGDSDMPVWGEILRNEGSSVPAPEVEVRGKLLLITEHLRAIQAP